MVALNIKLHKFLRHGTVRVLVVLTLLDLVAVGLYGLYSVDILQSRFFRIGRDRGALEIIQYVKVLLVIFMLWSQYKVSPSRLMKAWIVFFVALLCDDAIGIHEEIGEVLLGLFAFTPPLGMRAKDLAEICGFLLIEGTTGLYVAYCFIFAPLLLKKYSIQLALALAPLVFAGLVLDNTGYFILEEIGEILGASVLLAFVHHKFLAATTANTNLSLN